MKKRAGLLLVLLVALALTACSKDNSDDNNSVPNNEFSYNATYQGTIFDAVTGARITGEDLTITLVKGTDYQDASSIRRDATETTFAGDFAFTDVPVTLGGQATYRVVATRTGYQQFEAYITLAATNPVAGANNTTVDTVYNFVGNIYMFPLGATANDINVVVQYDGEPVVGATVLLQQNTAANTLTAGTVNQLAANGGLLGSMSATTNASGIANFPGASLALGAQYRPVVLPIAHEGVQLAETLGANITVGTQQNTQIVAMGDVIPGADNGVYVVSTTPADADDIVATGVRTYTFNRPVALVAEPTGVTATLATNSGPVRAVLTAADNLAVTMSADGLTMTVTPSFSTAPVAFTGSNQATADLGLTVTINQNTIYVTPLGDDTGVALDVLDLSTLAGVTVDAAGWDTTRITVPVN